LTSAFVPNFGAITLTRSGGEAKPEDLGGVGGCIAIILLYEELSWI
jgi:hypothetical protein